MDNKDKGDGSMEENPGDGDGISPVSETEHNPEGVPAALVQLRSPPSLKELAFATVMLHLRDLEAIRTVVLLFYIIAVNILRNARARP